MVSPGGKSNYQNNALQYVLQVSRCATLLLVLPQTIQYNSGDFYEVPGAVEVVVVTLKRSITLGTAVVLGRQNKQRQMLAVMILL